MDDNGTTPRDGQAAADGMAAGAETTTQTGLVTEPTRRQTTPTSRRVPRKPAAATAPPRRRRLGRFVRISVAVALILGGLAGIGLFRLSRGPVSLSAFKSMIEAAVTADLNGNTFAVRDVELSYGEHGLELALADVRISDSAGAALVQAPRAVLGLSGAAAMRGQIAFSRLELVSPRLQVFYADDGTLSVQFAQNADNADAAAKPAASDLPAIVTPKQPAAAADETSGAIDFVKALAEISEQARKREHVSAYLREIGLKQTTIVVDNGRRKTVWRVPDLQIDLSHKSTRSIIVGHAIVDSLTGPWSIDFQTAEIEGAQQMVVTAKVGAVNPRGLSRQVLSLAPFEQLDIAFDGETRIELTSKGVVTGATFALAARPGQIRARNSLIAGFVEAGTVKGSYDAASGSFTIGEAALSIDGNRLDLTGAIARAPIQTSDGLPIWKFDFNSTGGFLAPTTTDGAPIPITQFRARGDLVPEARRLLFREVALNAGGAAIAARGSVADAATDANISADLEARIAPMPIAQLIALWPSSILPDARSWAATHLTKGQLNSGVFRLANGGDNRLSLTLDIGNTEIVAARGAPPLVVPRGLVRLEGGGLEITIPDASIGPDQKRLQLKGLRLTAVETADGSSPLGEVAFRLTGPLATAVDVADREPFKFLKSRGVNLGAIEGKIDGQFKLTMPVSATPAASDAKVEGRVRITDGRLRQVIGQNDITGAKFDIDISETAIDGRGDFLVKGVPVKFAGQHFLNSTPDRQSPLRMTTKLDDADRAQLGLDINDLVIGEVPVEISIAPDANGEYQVQLDADLTRSELTLDSLAYRKAAGAPARLQFEVGKGAQNRIELRNFKIMGESIAAEGMIVLGPDGKPRELSFPDFSLNTVSRLDVQGHLRPDHVWDVRAKGATFDGRDLFRELFNVQNQSRPVPRDKPGLDLTAEIDTVLGFNETNLKSVRLVMQKRNDNGTERTTSLKVSALHEGGKLFEAQIRGARGDRTLTATSQDAGQTFRAVGFYPNANAGQMSLEVALDGRGAVERNGTLKAEKFHVLGDAVVSEVYQTGDAGGSTQKGARKKVVRERFDFDWMVLPFLVGCGQFVMNDVEIRGPLVGARMRGKADFKSQRVQIGGTYIPLSGLNSALGGLPVLGQILAGPKGEGIFGFTFAIQGAMANPDVLVNPLSGIIPGILRETQQLTPESYVITPCSGQGAAQRGDASRASSAAPTSAGSNPTAAMPRPAKPDVLTDWASGQKSSRQK